MPGLLSPEVSSKSRSWGRLLPLILALALLVVYWPALDAGFLWDDFALVKGDPFIRSWRLAPEGFHTILFFDAGGSRFFRPIQRLTYTGEYGFFGLDPVAYHLGSVLIHIAAAIMLAGFASDIATRWLRLKASSAVMIGFLIGLAWGVHPLHVSAVTYISGRADPLAAFFAFAAWRCAIRTINPVRGCTVRWILGAGACCLAAAFSKELGLTSFAVWIVVLVLGAASRRVLSISGLVAVAAIAIYCGLRFTSAQIPANPEPTIPWSERPTRIAEAVGEYARIVAFPVNLHMERSAGSNVAADGVEAFIRRMAGSALITLWLVALIVALRRKQTAIAMPLVGLVIVYLPISNLLMLNAAYAEHWFYQPLAFLYLAVSGVFVACWPRLGPTLRVALAGGAGLWVALGAGLTFQRHRDWRGEAEFLNRTVELGGDSARIFIYLARITPVSAPEQAAAYYRAALRRAPGNSSATLGLAHLAIQRGDFAGARTFLEALRGRRSVATDRLWLLGSIERFEGSGNGQSYLHEAIQREPHRWRLRRLSAEWLIADGRVKDAIIEVRDYLSRHSHRADAWLFLARLYIAQQDRPAAVVALAEARLRDVHLSVNERLEDTRGDISFE